MNHFSVFILPLCVVLTDDSPYVQSERSQSADLTSIDIRGNCSYVKGAPVTPGATTIDDDGRAIKLVAHGAEFGHHCGQDQGRFVFTPLTGDFDVIVQVHSVTNNHAKHFYDTAGTNAKAGIMAREGNGPGDRYVAIWAVSNDAPQHYHDAFHFDYRKLSGAWLGNQPDGCKDGAHRCSQACAFVYGYINPSHPDPLLFKRDYPDVWLRLIREGKKIFSMVSNDGKTWHSTSRPYHETDFSDQLFVGVALSGAAEGAFDARGEAEFRNVEGL
jgi:hypothetical protein